MAAGTIAAPGTEYGPCVGSCAHSDCAATRAMAATACGLCGKEIGYETRFYQEREYGLTHAVCLEKKVLGAK